jgi:cytochrome c553
MATAPALHTPAQLKSIRMKDKGLIATASLLIVLSGTPCAGMAGNPYINIYGCDSCHGDTDMNDEAIPSLSSKSQQELLTALREFKSGIRSGTVMNRIAAGLSDQDMQTLSVDYPHP